VKLLPITPPQRSLRLAQSGEEAVCIVERMPTGEEAMVEVRGREEAVALIAALVVALDLPALPASFGAHKLASV
jgi:hypothetical protein